MSEAHVLLIDRSRLFREGLKQLLAENGFVVTADACTPETAVELIRSGIQADIILYGLPEGGSELESVPLLRAAAPRVPLVLLSARISAGLLQNSVLAGVTGFLLKDVAPAALVRALALVGMGELVFPSGLAAMLADRDTVPATIPRMEASRALSARETAILRCLVHGHSNKIIADQLQIAEGTVKVHLKGVLKKIKAANRTQAAIWALNHGLAEAHG